MSHTLGVESFRPLKDVLKGLEIHFSSPATPESKQLVALLRGSTPIMTTSIQKLP